MKAISPALLAHYAQETTTIARCYRFQRRDATVYTVTQHDQDVTYAGETYTALGGVDPTHIDQPTGAAVSNSEVLGALGLGTIAEDQVVAGFWDGTTVVIFEVNYADLTMGRMILATGTLGNISTGRISFNSEQRGQSQLLQQQIGNLYSPNCTANLGDARCKVNLAPFTYTGTLTAVTDRRTVIDTGRTEAADWFGNGKITFNSGANAGISMEVLGFVSGQFALALPLPYNPAVGDTYTAIAGCRKTLKGNQSALGAVGAPLSGGFVISDASRTEAAGYFNGGSMQFTTGANAGKGYNIVSSSVGSFLLATVPSGTVLIADQYVITPAASTLYNGSCKVKFNNVPNNRSFPTIPGADKILGLGGTGANL